MTAAYTPAYREPPRCLVCGETLAVRLARGRKSGKPFVMLLCAKDGRHFRAFVNHQPYVLEVLARVEGQGQAARGEDDQNHGPVLLGRSTTVLEPGSGP